ncbi:US6 [Papio ursinus cytomegalovirus]|uniref:US6 n=1 Tax=Papiine betaherpesvirus 4 TaxID=2560624 RepID=A0A0F7G9L1_9BETA|nr:US6 [Papio ursinus cytomegalovirus]AKG51553.1 US6 [Papiine betaherpesvirus 4]
MKPLCTPWVDGTILCSLLFLLAFSGVSSAWSNDTKLPQRRSGHLRDHAETRPLSGSSSSPTCDRQCPLRDDSPACNAFLESYERAVQLLGCDPQLKHRHVLGPRGLFGCPKAPRGVLVLLEHYGGLTLLVYMALILFAVVFTSLMLYVMDECDIARHARRCGSH